MEILEHSKELRDGQRIYEVVDNGGHQYEFTTSKEAIRKAIEIGAKYIDVNRYDTEHDSIEPIYSQTL